MWAVGILTAAVAFGTTWLVTPLVERLAHRFGAVDRPGPRKVHAIPTPRVGGAAVFVGFVASLLVASYATGYASNEAHPRFYYWLVLAVSATGMLILGIVDDTRGVSFQGKFAGQLVAATAVWIAGFRVEMLGFPTAAAGGIELEWLSLPFTLLWIVGITNAFNLIDGLDGLAAGTALISTTTVAAIAILNGRVAVTAIAVALVGSLLGFLRYNFNPARIFLGDSGSMFLGFTLAVISIHGSQKNVTAVAVLVPLLLVGYPLLDTSLAVVRRLNSIRSDANGRGIGYVARNAHRVFLPDRGHLHHLLLDLGVSHRRAVLSLYACALALAVAAFALVVSNSLAVGLIVAGTLAGLTLLFVAFVIARARMARRRESQPSVGVTARPRGSVASGGLPGGS